MHLVPLLLMFQKKEQMNTDWIGPILKANSNATKEKDFDGKTPLHLAYQHGASSELINMLLKTFPEAENTRDNLGRFPKDLANQPDTTVFTPAIETLILADNLNDKKKSYPGGAVVMCRGDMLIRDPQMAQSNEHTYIFRQYSEQVLARHRIFETLLDEFAHMVGVDDKDVIQKAAAIQALAVQYLSNQYDAVINFGLCGNPGYWYQQEVLKLVMRVYHEGQPVLGKTYPSVTGDADFCMGDLKRRVNGEPAPKPSDKHVKIFENLARWLTEGIDSSSYTLQGPVLKPLQSLFNKLFIRRGQTSVSVIGDIVRGTLLVDDIESLQQVVKRIKNTFPNITKNQFRQPDKFDRLTDFLTYVHDNLNVLPGSGILPYRFKANSSQKQKDKPLWFNLNFFLQIPEYHRVGFSEMFVACELQIGVEEEVNTHRQTHVAYERDRILLSQPLLKNYDAMAKEGDENRFSTCSNCTEEDDKLIEKVLFGKIASEILIPCTTSAGNDNKNNHLLFENGPLSLSMLNILAGSFVKPERLCINNRSLNWYAINSSKADDDNRFCAAVHVAGPCKLDETKRYFVDSFLCMNPSGDFEGTIGLYAHIGPYLIQIACGFHRPHGRENIDMITSGQNFSYLEQVCPVPVGTTALEVFLYGRFANMMKYDKMKLSLRMFDVLRS